jgi:mRNA interferase MazF
MGPFTRGDVVLYAFPYSDLSKRKIRPCYVLSDQIGRNLILCQITSQNKINAQHSVLLEKKDFYSGNLRKESYIKTQIVFSAQLNQIGKKIGKVSNEKQKLVFYELIKIVKPHFL